jgi:hypothetical protein
MLLIIYKCFDSLLQNFALKRYRLLLFLISGKEINRVFQHQAYICGLKNWKIFAEYSLPITSHTGFTEQYDQSIEHVLMMMLFFYHYYKSFL